MNRFPCIIPVVSVLILGQVAAFGDEPTAPLADRVKSVVDAIDDGLDGQFREVASIRTSSPGTGPAISRDGSRVAYIDNNRLHLRSLEVEGLQAEVPVDSKTAFFLHIDPDPEHSNVAIADRHKFCVFDCESSKELLTRQLDASEDRFLEWTVSANGRFVAGLTSRMIVFVVDLQSNSVELHGFRGDEPLKNGSIAVSNDGKVITLLLKPNTILFVRDDQQPPNDVSHVRYVANPGAILSGGDDAFGLLADNDCTLVTLNGFDEINYFGGGGEYAKRACQMVVRDGHEVLMGAGKPLMNDKTAAFDFQRKAPYAPASWSLPDSYPIGIQWDGSGKRVAYRTRDRIRVLETPPYSYMQGRDRVMPLLRQILAEPNYEEIEQISQHILSHPSPLRPRPFDQWIGMLTDAIEELEPVTEETANVAPSFYHNWLTDRPDSKTATLVMAQWQVKQAWVTRGDAYASELTPTEVDGFERHLSAAEGLLGDLTTPGTPPQSISLALDVAKGLGWSSDKRQTLIDKLVQDFPDFEPAHYKVAETLLPRWGGAQGAVEEYMTMAADRLGDADGDRLYAQIALHLFQFFSPRDFFEQLDLDRSRINRGVLLTEPERNVDSTGYAKLILWHYANRKMDDAVQLVTHYQQHAVFFSPPLNDPKTAGAIVRSIKFYELRKRNANRRK